jgi:hypothetical protein
MTMQFCNFLWLKFIRNRWIHAVEFQYGWISSKLANFWLKIGRKSEWNFDEIHQKFLKGNLSTWIRPLLGKNFKNYCVKVQNWGPWAFLPSLQIKITSLVFDHPKPNLQKTEKVEFRFEECNNDTNSLQQRWINLKYCAEYHHAIY